MRSAGLKLLVRGLFLIIAVLAFSRVLMATEGVSSSDLGDIKTRLTAMEERQKEILAKEDQILAELDRIRVWVHRK